jgi:hypothetical protein
MENLTLAQCCRRSVGICNVPELAEVQPPEKGKDRFAIKVETTQEVEGIVRPTAARRMIALEE